MPRTPSWAVSTIPFIVLVVVLVFVIRIFGADSLSGGSQVALLLASAVIVLIAMCFYGVPWETLENSILENIRSVGTALLILLLIGAIAGTWMVSGVVPTLICYGMKVIIPSVFLAAASTLLAFGLLAFSSTPALHTFGLTLLIAMASVLVNTVLLRPQA